MRALLFVLFVFSSFYCVSCSSTPYQSKKMHFTYDWFTKHESIWKKHLKRFKGKQDIRYLEIGVFEGKSAFWVLDNILTHSSSRAVLVDPFLDGSEAVFRANLELHPRRQQMKIHKAYSQRFLRRLELNSFDFIYIDGSHLAKDVFIDIALAWDLLKIGGILVLDDYPWKKEEYPIEKRPQLAIDTFLTAFRPEISVLHKKWQVFIEKKQFEYRP